MAKYTKEERQRMRCIKAALEASYLIKGEHKSKDCWKYVYDEIDRLEKELQEDDE